MLQKICAEFTENQLFHMCFFPILLKFLVINSYNF